MCLRHWGLPGSEELSNDLCAHARVSCSGDCCMCVMCVRSHMCVFVVCVCLRDWLLAHVNFGSNCLQPHVHTMSLGGKRLRSRTPPRSRSSGECIFCVETITEQDKWVCFVCPVQAHKHCEEEWRTKYGANGCPQCRTTKTDVVNAQTLTPATKGIVCFICREVVREGDQCDSA